MPGNHICYFSWLKDTTENEKLIKYDLSKVKSEFELYIKLKVNNLEKVNRTWSAEYTVQEYFSEDPSTEKVFCPISYIVNCQF